MTQNNALAPLSAWGARGAVASGHPLASWAAFDVLSRGGHAVEAAITADAVLGLCEPMATGIGGDVLALVISPDGQVTGLNGTGRSPRGLTAEALERATGGNRVPLRGPLSVTVPGAVAAWTMLHERFGRLPFHDLLAPAIGLARDGFPVGPIVAREWRRFADVLRQDAETARVFRPDTPPEAGQRFANPDLAAALERIARDGAEGFYQWLAEQAPPAVQAAGGLLAREDILSHQGFFCEPLRQKHGPLEVIELPPNTHGIAVLHALEAIGPEPVDLGAADGLVRVVECVDDALTRVRATVGDPGNTVATTVVDSDGWGCTLMSSVFKRFGSGIAVPGGGFVLQNRAHGFAEPGHINGVAPGRRPYHTVIPGAALRDGRPFAFFGLVGGNMQPQGHVQIVTRLIGGATDPQAILDAPRFRVQDPKVVAVEEGIAPALRDALAAAGYSVTVGGADFGGGQVILRCDDGWAAGSDRRKDGIALAF